MNTKKVLNIIQKNIVNIVAICIILVIAINNFRKRNLIVVKTSNGDTHLVRNFPDKEEAAKLMDEIKRRLKILINNVKSTESGLLKERFEGAKIKETDLSESGTSYSINKGQELSLCLRDKNSAKLHNINILMFVSIHELAHLMSESYGHNGEFSKNFSFLLQKAVDMGLYQNEDYSKNEVMYCGMKVDSNPLF